jgi:hypothetical protein
MISRAEVDKLLSVRQPPDGRTATGLAAGGNLMV